MALSRQGIALIALCLGLLTASLTYIYLLQERTRAAQRSLPVQVVVANKPIAARTILMPSDLRQQMVPAATLPPNCATSIDEVAGQVAVAALAMNAPVTRNVVAPRNAGLGMAYVVPAGKRAVAVELDPIIGVAGYLKPGDRVDVVTTITDDDVKITRTVLQDVTLLAIGPTIRPEEERRPTSNRNARPYEQTNATLVVTPAQAETLILAEVGGKLRLILRPTDDRKILTLSGIRSDTLIGGTRASSGKSVAVAPHPAGRGKAVSSPAAPRPPARATTHQESASLSVETIRGTEKSTITVTAK